MIPDAGHGYVLDASVAAKWFLPAEGEPLAQQAGDLLELYANGSLDVLVPDLFWAEIGNLFWKASIRQRWSSSDAAQALHLMRDLRLPTLAHHPYLPAAMKIADGTGRSFYDSLYVAVAAQTGRIFLTADEKLANALGAGFPITWLGLLS